jgi:hypothetical protein
MKYLHFAAVDRQSTTDQQPADPVAALIETSDTAHRTGALTDRINTRGCDGRRYHDRCAQLITIRQGEQTPLRAHAESAAPRAKAATAPPGLVNPGCTIRRRTAVNWLTLGLTPVTRVNLR